MGDDWFDGTEDLNDARVSKPHLFEDFCEACRQHRPCSCDDMEADEELKAAQAACEHDWQEQPGEPPVDVCSSCGVVRR